MIKYIGHTFEKVGDKLICSVCKFHAFQMHGSIYYFTYWLDKIHLTDYIKLDITCKECQINNLLE